MPALRDLEIGVMFWAGRDPRETLREVKALGVSCGQLGVPGDMPLEGAAEAWRSALEQENFTVVTVFCAYVGESYADIPTVETTVGFIPESTRAEREQRTKDVSHFAAAIGVKSIACHVGFVPEDRSDPNYTAVRELVRRICDHAAKHGQTFALETGQEPAEILLEFLKDVDRQNLGINFDPANLIMYGSGDPIQAVEVLHEHLLSVHAKDGTWPPKKPEGALGTEAPLGEGAVGMDKFIAKLKQVGYKGTLNVEREIDDLEQKKIDMRKGVELLKRLTAAA
jgi:sugar phosphate isomerase/epimerase